MLPIILKQENIYASMPAALCDHYTASSYPARVTVWNGMCRPAVSVYLLIILLILSDELFSLRTPDGSDPLVPDYIDDYYYHNLQNKFRESLSINNCSVFGIGRFANLNAPKGKADLEVTVIPPPKAVKKLWMKRSKDKQTKLFTMSSPNLCTARQFLDFKKGYFKRGKGCYKMTETDRDGVVQRRINRYGATLHPSHVRCDVPTSVAACVQFQSSGLVEVDSQFRLLHEFPFTVTARNVIVAKSGMFALPCGPFGLLSSCEAVNWGVRTAAAVVPDVIHCRNKDHDLCPYKIYDKIFLISQYDDTQIGQFMMESFPRLVYHLDYLKANPDIKIHYGFTKQPQVPDFVLPHIFINWLGLGHRLINGTFYAHEAIMSREGGCQDAGYNAWEVVTMRETFIRLSGLSPDSVPRKKKPTVLIIVRSTSSFFVQNKFAKVRNWPKGSLPVLMSSLQGLFPNHDVALFKDSNKTLMTCPPCQVSMFNDAEIVIGMHGAGMSNNMYMRPGGVVVEVLPDFDSRHAPLVGIFPRLSGIIGLHHYSYYIKDMEFNATQLAEDTASYYHRIKMWTPHAEEDHH